MTPDLRPPGPRRIRLSPWLFPFVALLLTASYLGWNYYARGLLGFPLDDAWIHQTYARNLAETGQLAYLPGRPSAGSTSPAWSFLLSVGYLLGVDYRLWAYLLAGLALAAGGWFAFRLYRRLSPWRTTAALLSGLLCVAEWHLVWAAVSGMETMLFTALSLALLEYYLGHVADVSQPSAAGPASLRQERAIVRAVGLGLLGGVLTLTRPEGLGLAGLVIGAMAVLPLPHRSERVRTRLLVAVVSVVALGAILTPYLGFNLKVSGALWPNTFYAKQAEYRSQLEAFSLPFRLWQVLSPTLIGPQVLLLPGFGYALYRLVREQQWATTLPLVWWLAFLIVYALRLPVSYQHGRYTMPTIPLFLLYGSWGTAELLRPRAPQIGMRVLSRAMPLALALLTLIFLARGAVAYGDDVAFIEGEMVATAHWLNEHTAPDDLIAVHDIGAVGYLTTRPLLDLAGLITPEVVPFIADADRLADWLVQRGARYAVFFPDFSPAYARLATDPRFQQVHCTGYDWTRAMGQQNMCVYRVATPP